MPNSKLPFLRLPYKPPTIGEVYVHGPNTAVLDRRLTAIWNLINSQRAMGAHRVLCTCEKCAIFDPFFLMAKLTAVTAVFPDTRLPQIPAQSKNSDDELEQTMFHTENASGFLSS